MIKDPKLVAKIAGIKEHVRKMVEERTLDGRSNYWTYYCGKFEYLMGLAPEYFDSLRLHGYHLDSNWYMPYVATDDAARKYQETARREWNRIVTDVPAQYVVASPRIASEYGIETPQGLVNHNTVRFQGFINSMVRAGFFEAAAKTPEPVLMEIGGGYGGLAYAVKKILPKAHYVIVDLPEVILFSATYLAQCFPDAKISMYGPDFSSKQVAESDFTFVPNYALSKLDGVAFDFAVNTASFQEMTKEQIEGYLDFLKRNLRGMLYSSNDDHHPDNSSVFSLKAELDKRFALRRVGTGTFTPESSILNSPSRLLDVSPRKLINYAKSRVTKQGRNLDSAEYICTPKR